MSYLLKTSFSFQFDCCNIFCFRFVATRTWEFEKSEQNIEKKLIVIQWTAFLEYCNVDLYLYNLIFVLGAYEAVSHWFYTTERGLKRGRFLKSWNKCVFCVADCCKYNLYFIVCSILALSERLLSGRFTKEQPFSRADNCQNTKSSISDDPTPLSLTDLMTQHIMS
jgi:hypothetical protein